MSINQPPREKSNWRAAETTSRELETFLSNVERNLFSDTSRKTVSENLSKGEKESLWNWRKTQLLNPCGDLAFRSQGKGNRFVTVDKETDKLKAEEQIKRSCFVKLNYDPTFDHIAKVKVWAEKWYAAGEISKEWKDCIYIENARPGKNATLCKTQKPGNPVRL